MRRSWATFALGAALAAASACAPKLVALPIVTTPRFPDFVEPVVPSDLTTSQAGLGQQRAWQFLQAGDLKNASREASLVLKRTPKFYPAETTAGYVELAQKDARSALARFDRALAVRADYTSALVGKGEALTQLDR